MNREAGRGGRNAKSENARPHRAAPTDPFAGPLGQILRNICQNRCSLFSHPAPSSSRMACGRQDRQWALRRCSASSAQRARSFGKVSQRRAFLWSGGMRPRLNPVSLGSASQVSEPCLLFHHCRRSMFDSFTISSSGSALSEVTERLPVQSRIEAAPIQVNPGPDRSRPVFIAGSTPCMAREQLSQAARAGNGLVNEVVL
jgi:hypothetical protein